MRPSSPSMPYISIRCFNHFLKFPGCCCAARDAIPVTTTRYGMTLTSVRTVIVSSTPCTRRVVPRSDHKEHIAKRALSEIKAENGLESVRNKTKTCPSCPSSAISSTGASDAGVSWCCAPRRTVTLIRVAKITKTVTLLSSRVRGFLFADTNSDGVYSEYHDADGFQQEV